MNDATIKRLNALNRRFYEITARSFDETRATPWPGWDRLLPHLRAPIAVLDVGCGNGRFGLYLRERLGAGVAYHGVDSNPTLLERARLLLAGTDALLEERDILDAPLPAGSYDLVALFGVLHHIPGEDQRRALLQNLVQRVKPGGFLVFTAWCFLESERLRARIAPWPADLEAEAHDYLLDWRRGEPALRYCHYVDEDEHARLVSATGLRLLETYRADGQNAALNRYSILQRETPAS